MGVSRDQLEKGTRVKERIAASGGAVHWKHGRVTQVHRLMADVLFDGHHRARPTHFNRLWLESEPEEKAAPAPALSLVPSNKDDRPAMEALDAWLTMGAGLRAELADELETLRSEANAVDAETRRLEDARDDLTRRIESLAKQINRIDAVAPPAKTAAGG